jgi:ABC-type sugar transport system permease subunit
MTSGTARWKRVLTPWLFLAPFGAIFFTFTVYPLAYSVFLSTRQTVGTGIDNPVGWQNFGTLFVDKVFWESMLRTAYFAGMSLVIQLPAALGLALLVNRKRLWGRAIFRTAFFLPVLVGPAFIGVAFRTTIFGLQDGVVNAVLGSVGVPAIDWLRDPNFVMNTLVVTGVWMFAGFNMIYFLAGLQGIPTELYEAARVDGANVVQRFWNVTIPGIWPIAAFLITASTIGSFGLFDLPWVLTEQGGPGYASTTIMVYLYQRGFVQGELGYAAAMGWMVTVILLIIALVQLKLSRAWAD